MGDVLVEEPEEAVAATPSAPSPSPYDDPKARTFAYVVAATLIGYLVLQLLWPAPVGVLLQGVVIGGLTALIAFGVALIYRSNRIINFAQGDLGGAPAALGVLLIIGPGVPYLVALPISLLAGLALGALVELLFIRRFSKAPRLLLTVVTIGVSTILAGLTVALPQLIGLEQLGSSFPAPFGFTFRFGETLFSGNEIIAMVTVPVVIAALAGFFRFTSIGIAVRASAESSDRAALLGVPVKRIQTIVWMIASLLATTAIFMRAGILGLPIGSVLGPTILIRALAAAVVGRMERLPTIFAASIALGILEASILFSTGTSLIVDAILFVVVLVTLLFQRRGKVSRADDDQTSSWQAAREVKPIPREMIRLPEVRWGLRGLQALGLLVAVLLPAVLSIGQVNLAAVVIMIAIVGTSLVILTGWAGQVSLGQIGFFGIGAAAAGAITQRWGWDLSLALVGAGIAGAVSAMVIGLPALRIKGLFLAVITLSFALAVSSYALNPDYVSWLPTGRVSRPPLFGRIAIESEARFYYLCLASLLLAIAVLKGLRNSRTGRALIGVRENQRAAQSYGVNATAAKLTAFASSGFIAAFAGGLFVHHQQGLGISAYSVGASRDLFVLVVIGGLGSVAGPILGAIVIQGTAYFSSVFPEVVRPYLTFITSGVGLVIVLLLLPGGLSQILYGLRDNALRRIADRRGMLVPSLNADKRAVVADEEPLGGDPPTHAHHAPDVSDELAEALVLTASGVGEATPPTTDPSLLLEPDAKGNGNGGAVSGRRRAPLVAPGRKS